MVALPCDQATPVVVRIIFFYSLFAAISIVANILSQYLFVSAYDGPGAILISVVVGTGVGLAAKYVMDKTWIFRFEHRNAVHGIRTFTLYTVMGIATTAIFWLFEFGFFAIFKDDLMRYAGGIVGLTIGYAIKYHLDKALVFRPAP